MREQKTVAFLFFNKLDSCLTQGSPADFDMLSLVVCAEFCTMKPVQLTQDIFWLPGLTNPNIGCLDKRYYKAGYQLVQATLPFPIQPWACSCERGRGVYYEWQHQNHEWSRLRHIKWDDSVPKVSATARQKTVNGVGCKQHSGYLIPENATFKIMGAN